MINELVINELVTSQLVIIKPLNIMVVMCPEMMRPAPAARRF